MMHIWQWIQSRSKQVIGHGSCESVRVSVASDSLWPHGLHPTRLLCPWGFPGKNTGVGCHFLLQGIFPTQGLNPRLLHCRQPPSLHVILYQLSHQGSPGKIPITGRLFLLGDQSSEGVIPVNSIFGRLFQLGRYSIWEAISVEKWWWLYEKSHNRSKCFRHIDPEQAW